MIVLEFPPKESANNLVSLESLYGIWLEFLTNKFITFIRLVKERFIFIPSCNASPVVFVYFVFSDPAKSTKFNLPIQKYLSPLSEVTELSIMIVNIE